MKKHLLLAIVISGMLTSVGCRKSESTHADHQQKSETSIPAPVKEKKVDYWTCSMHPLVRSDKPGNCPICGMTLVPIYAPEITQKKSASAGEVKIQLSEEGIRLAGVQVEKAQQRKLAKELLIFGTIGYDLNSHRNVVPLVSGRIDKQFIDYNQTEVKKGEPLVSLYSPEALGLQEDYLKAVRERWLSTFYERDLLTSAIQLAEEKLLQIGFSKEDIEKLRDEEKPVDRVIVRSPISGSIVSNRVHIGGWVKADEVLYNIAPLDELWFDAQVFEPDLGLLKLGQEVRITAESAPGREVTGKLIYIGRALDETNRTVSVRFWVSNKDRLLLPNLSATGSLDIPLGNEVLSVPNGAVLNLGTRDVIFVQKEKGVYVPRDVRVGHKTRHYTQILEGVKEGEDVVTAGAFLIDAQKQLRANANLEQEEMPAMPSMPEGHQH